MFDALFDVRSNRCTTTLNIQPSVKVKLYNSGYKVGLQDIKKDAVDCNTPEDVRHACTNHYKFSALMSL